MQVRRGPTWRHLADPPTWGEEWEKQTYREHIKAWTKMTTGVNMHPWGIYLFLVVTESARACRYYSD